MGWPSFGTVILVGLLFLVIAAAGWIVYVHLRARRLGLPTPTLASYSPFSNTTRRYSVQPRTGGLIGWVSDKWRTYKYNRNRSAAGAYEGTSLDGYNAGRSGRGSGGRGAQLDPDEAWDTRVGTEADAYGPQGGYYEEELGLQGNASPNTTTYHGASAMEDGRGRQTRREEEETFTGGTQEGLDRRYDQEMGITQGDGTPSASGVTPHKNPFDDANKVESSLTGISPPPVGSAELKGHNGNQSLDVKESSAERRSLFKEDM